MEIPIGTILSMVTRSPAPVGWLLCDGSQIPLEYEELRNILNSKTLPNLTGRVLMGGGNTANAHINTDNSQVNFPKDSDNLLGSYGGEWAHTLTTKEMPTHNHKINDGHLTLHEASFAGESRKYRPYTDGGVGNHIGATDNSGSGRPHNNLPPYFVVNYYICTGVLTTTNNI